MPRSESNKPSARMGAVLDDFDELEARTDLRRGPRGSLDPRRDALEGECPLKVLRQRQVIEVDVDVVSDFEPLGADTKAEASQRQGQAVVCGVMEHIEEAGVHSGDSSCTIPPYSLPTSIVNQVKDHARRLAQRLPSARC